MSTPKAVFLIYAVNMVAVLVGVVLLTYFGRKPILIMGSAVQTASLLGLGISMWAENATWPLVLSLIAVAFFEISSGPIVWMYLGEITTDKGASFCTIANGLVNMCVAIFPRSINKAWGPWKGPALMFYFCFVCSLLGTIFLVFYMKETKGLTNA